MPKDAESPQNYTQLIYGFGIEYIRTVPEVPIPLDPEATRALFHWIIPTIEARLAVPVTLALLPGRVFLDDGADTDDADDSRPWWRPQRMGLIWQWAMGEFYLVLMPGTNTRDAHIVAILAYVLAPRRADSVAFTVVATHSLWCPGQPQADVERVVQIAAENYCQRVAAHNG